MSEPKDLTTNNHYKFFQNKECPFWMCHTGVKEEDFSCLHCYCPLTWLECPGPYEVFTDKHGNKRKDCSACNLPHNGLEKSWNFIQHWLENPKPWDGQPQTEQRMKAAALVEHPREGTNLPTA
jgi:Zn-finger protein